MPEFLITIPVYHSLTVSAATLDDALDTASRTPYTRWDMDDCQPDFDRLLQGDDVSVDEV